ncbi:RHS repeat domain-containing protein [Marivirga sp.]|uniref:RHS repeat domain-containing protein n=1 Tax=Marivirga sp. TaxID=2018662 RepID=UPI003DA7A107
MRNIILLLLSFFIATNNLKAQQEIAEPQMIDILPPSPEASEFIKNIDIDLNEYVGKPNVSIPITNISTNNLQWPVSLSYDAGGLKVEEEASAIGAGWTLNATGLIGRTARQHPDEQGANYSYNIGQNHGYFSDMANFIFNEAGNVDNAKLSNLLNDGPNQPSTSFKYETASYADSLADGYIDTHADMYYFNFGAHSGKFYYTPTRQIVQLQYNTLNFKEYPFKTASYPIDMPGEAYYWEITDEKGITYKFEKAENITTSSQSATFVNGNGSAGDITDTDYQSAWYLTEMSIGSEFIKFNYENINFVDIKYYTEGKKLKVWVNGSNQSSLTTNTTTTNGYRLKSIVSSKKDSVLFHYNTEYRLDKTNKQKLDKISIFKNGTNVKDFRFFQSYFGIDTKLRLDSIREENGNLKKPPYKFEYYDGANLPPSDSKEQDFWGYFNNNDSNTLIPEYKTDLYHFYMGLADRKPNLFYTRLGTLQKITYPTGGYHLFEYELNQVFDPNYKETFFQEARATQGTFSNPETDEVFFSIPSEVSATIRSSLESQDGIGMNAFSDIYKKDNNGNYLKYSPQNAGSSFQFSNRVKLVAGDYKLYAVNDGEGDINEIFISLEYELPNPQNKIVGGLRVANIESYDEIASDPKLIKTFKYTDRQDSEKSSGVLFIEPYFGGYLSEYVPGELRDDPDNPGLLLCYQDEALIERYINLNAYSSNNLTFMGSHVGYTNVDIIVEGGIGTSGIPNLSTPEELPMGKTSKQFIADRPFNPINHPYIDPEYLGHLNGKLTDEHIVNNNGVSLYEKHHYYSSREYEDFLYIVNTFRKKRTFCYRQQPIIYATTKYLPRYSFMDSTVSIQRDTLNREIITKTYYEYDEEIVKPRRVVNIKENNTIEEKFYTWDSNYSGRLTSMASFRYGDQSLIEDPIDQKLPYKKSYKKFYYSNNQLQSSFAWDRTNNSVNFAGAANLSDSLSEIFGSIYNTYFANFNGSGNIVKQHFKQQGNTKKLFQWDAGGIYPEAQLITTGENEFFKVFNFENDGNYSLGATGKKSMNGSTSVSIEDVPIGNYILGFKAKDQNSSSDVSIEFAPTTIPIAINGDKWDYYQTTIELSSLKTIQVNIPSSVQLDDLVIYPAEAEITYFTIEDGKGISSQTDSNGNTTYYEYDDLGRLIRTKDDDQNMLSKILYNYKDYNQN